MSHFVTKRQTSLVTRRYKKPDFTSNMLIRNSPQKRFCHYSIYLVSHSTDEKKWLNIKRWIAEMGLWCRPTHFAPVDMWRCLWISKKAKSPSQKRWLNSTRKTEIAVWFDKDRFIRITPQVARLLPAHHKKDNLITVNEITSTGEDSNVRIRQTHVL